jgi:hypothetical protein
MTAYIKDPASLLDYVWNWAPWLEPDSDTISSYEVVAAPGITVDSDSTDGKKVTVWLEGGTLGASYDVTDERTNTFTIRNRHA